jgi:histone H3/H4
MPGRGKSGKGLGKGAAKRDHKVLRDNIQGITKPAIRRLARTDGELSKENVSHLLLSFNLIISR